MGMRLSDACHMKVSISRTDLRVVCMIVNLQIAQATGEEIQETCHIVVLQEIISGHFLMFLRR
jgi:hypothetical protein